ncbi:RNA binding protein fox-1 homolog 1-like isoform X2 [Oncorhynchus keta]|uniref:RNA binding protein fox-1 homolog 1-like isoform X2 n=1 Tax=Oncorhynchus keta TaxID=8018 RepID=UPI00227C1F83|nr:RNA binding protein fox-1 homolog 1-like isoform X2 [Oncorhynchus keta]
MTNKKTVNPYANGWKLNPVDRCSLQSRVLCSTGLPLLSSQCCGGGLQRGPSKRSRAYGLQHIQSSCTPTSHPHIRRGGYAAYRYTQPAAATAAAAFGDRDNLILLAADEISCNTSTVTDQYMLRTPTTTHLLQQPHTALVP